MLTRRRNVVITAITYYVDNLNSIKYVTLELDSIKKKLKNFLMIKI